MFSKVLDMNARNGSVAGYETKCEYCGMILRSSLATALAADAAAHAAWHARGVRARAEFDQHERNAAGNLSRVLDLNERR